MLVRAHNWLKLKVDFLEYEIYTCHKFYRAEEVGLSHSKYWENCDFISMSKGNFIKKFLSITAQLEIL